MRAEIPPSGPVIRPNIHLSSEYSEIFIPLDERNEIRARGTPGVGHFMGEVSVGGVSSGSAIVGGRNPAFCGRQRAEA